MLGHMKGVKMSGLAKGLEVSINQLRTDEIKAAAPFRLVSSLSSTIAQIPILLAPVATFAFFAIVALRTGQTFEATRLFSSLSFVILLAAPLFGTLEAILDAFSALACFDRIEKYLNEQSRQDGRRMHITPSGGPSQGRGSSELRLSGRDSASSLHQRFELVDMPARNASPQRDASNINDIQLQNSSFGWTDDSRFVLENVSFIVKKDQFVLLTGPVASGKTTLMKGILGEVPFTLGTVKLRHHKLSWCDQTPWLTVSVIFVFQPASVSNSLRM